MVDNNRRKNQNNSLNFNISMSNIHYKRLMFGLNPEEKAVIRSYNYEIEFVAIPPIFYRLCFARQEKPGLHKAL